MPGPIVPARRERRRERRRNRPDTGWRERLFVSPTGVTVTTSGGSFTVRMSPVAATRRGRLRRALHLGGKGQWGKGQWGKGQWGKGRGGQGQGGEWQVVVEPAGSGAAQDVVHREVLPDRADALVAAERIEARLAAEGLGALRRG